MSIDHLPRLTRIDKALADQFAAEGLGAPRVFVGDDGSYWVLSDELRAWRATHTSKSEPA